MSGSEETHRSRSSLAAAEAFDRVGLHARRVALWIVRDEKLAHDVVVAAFAQMPKTRRGIPDDPSVLYDVRRRAIEAVASRPATPASDQSSALEAEGLSSVIAGLAEPQRAVIELAFIGELNATAIARAADVPRRNVIALLAGALRKLPTTQAQSGNTGGTRPGPSSVRHISLRQSQSQANLE